MKWFSSTKNACEWSIFILLSAVHPLTARIAVQQLSNNTAMIVWCDNLVACYEICFLGYVLPWGQMSLWGATVITNLISTVPIIGTKLVWWVWGGYNVDSATLTFFFTLHFLVPFIIAVVVLFHLVVLHETSRTSSLIMHERFTKVAFHPYFVWKDLLNAIILFVLFSILLFVPWAIGDPENWLPANQMSRPVHIQPEWYFLFAYAILRRVPNKIAGVVALVMRVTIFYLFPFCKTQYPKNKIITSWRLSRLACSWFLLTLLGACSVEAPYILMSQIFRICYFAFIILYLT